MAAAKKKNSLGDLDVVNPTQVKPPRPRTGKAKRRRGRKLAATIPGNTRIADDVKTGGRLPPPVPPGRSLREVVDLDPDDPAFKHKRGRHRKVRDPNDLRDMMAADKQGRMNARRAKARKNEATAVAAAEVMEKHVSRKESKELGVYDEDLAVAQGILDLDDWSNEELIRGYRKNRNGRFGKAPKYIPRELQQEMFRRVVQRGEGSMRKAYLESIERLIDLAQNASSEKVRLEAIKELMNRVVGKIPDIVITGQAKPYEDILADSLVPISDTPPISLSIGDDGVARSDPFSE
jgi:hypothetical protein